MQVRDMVAVLQQFDPHARVTIGTHYTPDLIVRGGPGLVNVLTAEELHEPRVFQDLEAQAQESMKALTNLEEQISATAKRFEIAGFPGAASDMRKLI